MDYMHTNILLYIANYVPHSLVYQYIEYDIRHPTSQCPS